MNINTPILIESLVISEMMSQIGQDNARDEISDAQSLNIVFMSQFQASTNGSRTLVSASKLMQRSAYESQACDRAAQNSQTPIIAGAGTPSERISS